jgi:hypothetical protein
VRVLKGLRIWTSYSNDFFVELKLSKERSEGVEDWGIVKMGGSMEWNQKS